MRRWRKFKAGLAWRVLTLEAACFLVGAKFALKVVPFRRLERYLEKRVRGPQLDGEARAKTIRQVQRAVIVMSRRLPGRYVCFPRGIAAQAMLRRRRVATTLYYGASTQADKGLTGHVWVMDGDEGVIGFRFIAGHKVLARYPKADERG